MSMKESPKDMRKTGFYARTVDSQWLKLWWLLLSSGSADVYWEYAFYATELSAAGHFD